MHVSCCIHIPPNACPAVQLYTQVEAYTAAIGKLQEMGFKVNIEDSELIYRGTAGESLDATATSQHALVMHAAPHAHGVSVAQHTMCAAVCFPLVP